MTGLDWSRLADPLNVWLVLIAALGGIAASDRFGAAFRPDAQPTDPVGWLTVQAGHLWVGVALVLVLPSLWLLATLEFPDRAPLLAACVVAPAAFEACQWLRYGGGLADKIADTAFMALPPVGAVLSFRWQGGLDVSGSLGPALWCLGAVALVGAVGAWRRM